MAAGDGAEVCGREARRAGCSVGGGGLELQAQTASVRRTERIERVSFIAISSGSQAGLRGMVQPHRHADVASVTGVTSSFCDGH